MVNKKGAKDVLINVFCIGFFFFFFGFSPRDAHHSVRTSCLSAPSHAHILFSRPTRTCVVLAGACGYKRPTRVSPNPEVDPALRPKGKKRDIPGRRQADVGLPGGAIVRGLIYGQVSLRRP